MKKLYDDFYNSCKVLDQFVQEHKWKNVKNRLELKILVESEFSFWKRVLSLLPPEKKLLNDFAWFKNCYEQIVKNLENEKINWKVRWLQDGKDSL